MLWLLKHPFLLFASLFGLGAYDPNLLALVGGGLIVSVAVVPKWRRALAEMFKEGA